MSEAGRQQIVEAVRRTGKAKMTQRRWVICRSRLRLVTGLRARHRSPAIVGRARCPERETARAAAGNVDPSKFEMKGTTERLRVLRLDPFCTMDPFCTIESA
ncbi:hypothetical protein WOLCODRAFT_160608 [Wolfiporia cocos MD-104 SS10]|uniref:Uncharacterized protein n=1 Tax=Wolfiporia cocos (strain MD-104) TaxID=742152 RepID=A0A2H3IWJ0_WOLCO|nr:hypothetical protein WOLCODRAFT_160608 [Wolfiporia cocos MD-104 SS10]